MATLLSIRLFSVISFFALYVFIREFLAPYPSIKLVTKIPEIEYSFIDVALDVASVLLAILIAWAIFKYARALTLVAVLFSVFFVTDLLFKGHDLYARRGAVEQTAGPASQKPNVYHAIFDGFGGNYFMDEAREHGFLDEFEGFYFFPKTKANYFPTDPSMASIMRSDHFRLDSDLHLGAWVASWRSGDNKGTIFSRFLAAGYGLHQFTDIPGNSSNIKSVTRVSVWLKSRVNGFLAIYASRISPVIWREAVMRGVLSARPTRSSKIKAQSPLDYRVWDSPVLFAEMLEGEAKRPATDQYLFSHGFNPHGPFLVNADCAPVSQDTRKGTLGCSVLMMVNLIRELKRLGRYDNSTILIHSDHGNQSLGVEEDFDLEFSRSFNRYFFKPNTTSEAEIRLLRMTNPLLLIKPPKSKGPIRVVQNDLVELVDIAPTLFGLAGLETTTPRGKNIFSEGHKRKRGIHLFPEAQIWKDNWLPGGKFKRWEDVLIPHLFYRSGGYWEVRPPLSFSGKK